MKKRLLFMALAVLVLLSALPALAAAPADLNALARYFPADTPLFISTRIDDDFIATIDSIGGAIAANFPDADMDATLQQLLDDVVTELYPDGSFQTTMRPWLGDTASFGVLSLGQAFSGSGANREEAPALIAISITDQTAALDFVINALNQDETRFFQTTGDGYTLLVVGERSMPAALDGAKLIIVRDDVLLFSANTDASLIAVSGLQSPSLLEQPGFSAALSWLPADSYSVTVYADVMDDLLAASAAADPEGAGMLSMLEANFAGAGFGPQVVGFTILDGSVLTIDVAQAYDPAALPATAMPGPVDPAFAARIPADIPLALHGTNLKGQLEALAESYTLLFESMAAQPDVDAAELEAARDQFQKQLVQLNNLFTSVTDLDFQEDVLSWLDGDVIAFAGFNPDLNATSAAGLQEVFPLELGIGVEATDPAKAQAAVEGFTKAFNQLAALANLSMNESARSGAPAGEATVTSEELAGVTVTVLTLTTPNLPWAVELLMGANNSIFALGTRGAVSAMFAADGGLPSNAEFRAAQAYLLPDPIAVAWLNPAGLLPLADIVGVFASGSNAAEAPEEVRELLSFFRSGTATSAYDAENNVVLGRFTLALALEQ